MIRPQSSQQHRVLMLLVYRSNLEKTFHIEEVYDGDISVVQIATCKANSERVIIKSFKRDKLVNRVDLQNKVGGGTQPAGTRRSEFFWQVPDVGNPCWHKQQQVQRQKQRSCLGRQGPSWYGGLVLHPVCLNVLASMAVVRSCNLRIRPPQPAHLHCWPAQLHH